MFNFFKMNRNPNTKSKDISPIIIVIPFITVLLLWIYNYFFLKNWEGTLRGTIGDMYGPLNTLFSGLAFCGIIFTIILQSKELKLQREELANTRKEFETQNETLKVQRFENTFFNLLNLHHQIVNSMDITYYKMKEKANGITRFVVNINEEKESVKLSGRDVFKYQYDKLHKEMKDDPNSYELKYMLHYEKSHTDFGHYFRNLYRMIKLVDTTSFFYEDSVVSENEIFQMKYRYISIIRSQLSDYELLWLFYNCISPNGREKFKPLIEKYSFLKNLPKKYLVSQVHIGLYETNAFEHN